MHQLLAPVDPADLPLLVRAREIYARDLGNKISTSELRELNVRQGTDMATAVLYVHFESILRASAEPLMARADNRPLLVAIAPGAFYKEHPEVGADGRELLELSTRQRWESELIPSESIGTLHVNARIINDLLERAARVTA